jgi:hypothetical protein
VGRVSEVGFTAHVTPVGQPETLRFTVPLLGNPVNVNVDVPDCPPAITETVDGFAVIVGPGGGAVTVTVKVAV